MHVEGRAAGLHFAGDGGQLAPHVIVGHVDIASAGVRAMLLLREGLRCWAGPEKTVGKAGSVSATPEDGVDSAEGAAQECAPAWKGAGQASPAAALQVDTYRSADGVAVVSVVCINAQFPVMSANAVALDLVRKIVEDKVRSTPSCACAATIALSGLAV